MDNGNTKVWASAAFSPPNSYFSFWNKFFDTYTTKNVNKQWHSRDHQRKVPIYKLAGLTQWSTQWMKSNSSSVQVSAVRDLLLTRSLHSSNFSFSLVQARVSEQLSLNTTWWSTGSSYDVRGRRWQAEEKHACGARFKEMPSYIHQENGWYGWYSPLLLVLQQPLLHLLRQPFFSPWCICIQPPNKDRSYRARTYGITWYGWTMNGDNVLLLVDELLRPWRFLDVAFYAGSLYGVYKLTGFVFKVIKGVRTYFIPAGRATNSDLNQKFGKWAGSFVAALAVKYPCLSPARVFFSNRCSCYRSHVSSWTGLRARGTPTR